MPRRGECIYKRKDGRWEARFVKEITADGKKKYGSVYANTYKEVKEKQQYYLFTPVEAVAKASSNYTVAEIMNMWLEHIKPTVKASTYQKYQSMTENHIKPQIGHIPLRILDRSMVDRFAQEQVENGRKGGGSLSVKTVNDILIILGIAFRFAEDDLKITLPRITCMRESKKEARVLSVKEEKILLQELLTDTDAYKFGILLSLYTGIRIGELCALKWEDITDNSVVVSKTLQRLKTSEKGTELIIGEPKTETSKRMIPLPDFLQPFIKKFRKPSGYILQTRNGTPTEPRTLQLKFQKTVALCGLKNVNFHALRHTFATRCVESGFDIKSLSEILGHSDVKTTLNRYVHSSFNFKKENMQKLSLPINTAV